MGRKEPDDYSTDEAQRRFEATLRGALVTPPQLRPAKPSPPKKKRGAYVRKADASRGTGRP
jgi:hypothetical protein